jgi:hypothetical protein
MRTLIPASALLILFAVGGCAPTDVVNSMQIYDPVDAVQQYTQRADKVTLSAGNAQEVNTRIHEIDPWPRNVGDKRIAVNGEKMADAVYRYRCGKSPQPPLVPIGTSSTLSTGVSSAAAVGATRPGSECAGGGAPVPAQR